MGSISAATGSLLGHSTRCGFHRLSSVAAERPTRSYCWSSTSPTMSICRCHFAPRLISPLNQCFFFPFFFLFFPQCLPSPPFPLVKAGVPSVQPCWSSLGSPRPPSLDSSSPRCPLARLPLGRKKREALQAQDEPARPADLQTCDLQTHTLFGQKQPINKCLSPGR